MTNSPRKVSLTAEQLKELKRDYCEILVDNMDTKTLVQYVYDDLLSWCDGLTSEEMKCFYSPTGLDLNAVTPEQIALSILSEIVMVDNKATGKQMKSID